MDDLPTDAVFIVAFLFLLVAAFGLLWLWHRIWPTLDESGEPPSSTPRIPRRPGE